MNTNSIQISTKNSELVEKRREVENSPKIDNEAVLMIWRSKNKY